MLHQRYWQNKIYFPTKIHHQKVDFEGAIVLQPKEGIHKNVAVFDFAAMYTSIYITFNYSPEVIVKNDEREDDVIITTDIGTTRYRNWSVQQGILPKLEKEMLQKRNEFKKERDKWPGTSVQYRVADELQGTFKTILNSIYGVAAYEKFILFNPNVAASITATARKLIMFVSDKAKEMGYDVLYGDTDSIFIHIDGDTTQTFVENAKSFEKQINESFPDFIRQFTSDSFTQNNYALKIEFEKAFDSLLLTFTKKRYFGKLSYRKGKVHEDLLMSVVGFETRRDDTPDFFKERLGGAYELILSQDTERLKIYCKETKRLLSSQHPSALTIKIKLSQGSDKYEHLPMHVRALRNANVELKRGESVHMLYVKGDTEVIHYEVDKKYDIDYDMYYKKFFENKIRLISEVLWQQLFSEQHSLAAWL
jgi:DNA polymerase elongation subunit (family B)